MDHLMGRVFVEYLSPLKRDRIRTKHAEEDAGRAAWQVRCRPACAGADGAALEGRLRRHARVCPRGLAGHSCAGHEVPLVLTQPDRPAGRGLKLQASP
jgi:hypothetical protein